MSAFDVTGVVPAFPGGSTAFPNAVRDAPTDPGVAGMIEETGDLVREFLDINHTFADDAITEALSTMNALKLAVVPPALPDPPPAPAIVTSFTSVTELGFDTPPNLGSITSEDPGQFFPAPVTIPDIESDIPVYTSLGLTIVIPDPPSLLPVAEPTEPGIDTSFVIPDAPAKDYGGAPDLDEIILPTYVPPVIPVFNDEAPTLDVLPPDPIIQWREPTYTSDVKDAVQSVLLEMLAGGTGLPADVELAIWERGREREDIGGLRTIDEAYDGFTTRGFDHPQGQLNAQILAVTEEVHRKVTELSREVMIKQAELEQTNRNFAVEKAITFEQVYVAVFLAIVDRNFQIAKFAVETQIQVYNLRVTAFNVEQQVYAQKIAKYRVDLDAALFDLKVFEALVEAEKAKAEINTAKVQAFDAQVRAYGSQVEAYKAIVQAASVHADLQKNLVEVYKAQVDAMVAKINAQKSKFDAYESQIKGETAKIALEEANSRVYATRVQAWAETANVTLKRADIELQENRQTLEWNIANMQRLTSKTGQELNLIQANLAAYQASTSRATAKYSADSETARANLQAQVSLSQVAIAKYSAMIEQWRVRAQEIIQFATVGAESLRAAGQMAATMVSGALAGTHVSAGISAGSSASQGSSRSSTDNTTQTKSTNENDNFSIIHSYQHRT